MMKIFKRILLFGVFFIAIAGAGLIYFVWQSEPEGFHIIEYHKINDYDNDPYTIHPEEFAEQLDYLKAKGYTTITVLDYLKARRGEAPLPKKPILLSFDDGYRDNYTTAVPLLEERGMKGTFFIVTNDVGLDKYMTWEDLLDLQNRGWELGSHTANHLPLTEMSDEFAEEEMKVTKLITTWHGLKRLFGFSYPNGAYKKEYAEMLRRQSYYCALTGDAGLNTLKTKPYELHRTIIPRPRLGLFEFKLRMLRSELYALFNINRHEED